MTNNQTIDGVPLLPCPFCGDTPEITKHHREDIYGLIHRCPVAGAISWGFIEDPALHVKRWNRRHAQEQPAPVAVVRCSFCEVTDQAGNPWSGQHESVDGKLTYRVMGCKNHKHLVDACRDAIDHLNTKVGDGDANQD